LIDVAIVKPSLLKVVPFNAISQIHLLTSIKKTRVCFTVSCAFRIPPEKRRIPLTLSLFIVIGAGPSLSVTAQRQGLRVHGKTLSFEGRQTLTPGPLCLIGKATSGRSPRSSPVENAVAGAKIPPNSALNFEVELLPLEQIEKYAIHDRAVMNGMTILSYLSVFTTSSPTAYFHHNSKLTAS